MCGIAGILSFENSLPDTSVVHQMSDAMKHRGPDATGEFTDDRIAFGHNRLCVIDLSTAANQPFSDESGRYHLIFNGEIYNYQEIRRGLSGYTFTSSSDTEVLLASYIKWGPACLQHLKGMFVFAIWDTQENLLFAARDRMGVKPFYYFQDNQYFIFGSEIRALLASGLIPKRINRTGVYDFLSYQSVGFPISPVEGIQQLGSGCYIIIKNGIAEITKYWDITKRADINFDFNNKQKVHKKIRELLLNAVECRLISDVPLGAFLSGGIDSTAVVGLMKEVSGSQPNTFNVGFEEEDYDESVYAEMVARKFNTKHNKITLKAETFLDELTNALDAMDSPSGDGVNTYVVSKAIKNGGLTVALSGVGGDELFAGYPFFKQFLQLKRYQPVWSGSKWIREMATTVIGRSSKSERLKKLLKSPVSSIRYFYPEFRRILAKEQLSLLTNLHAEDLCNKRIPAAMEEFPLLSQVSIAEYLGYTQHTLLKDTDQMSMAVSLEVREPFFDHDLIEFVLNVPDKLKYPHYPKQLLVESLDGLIPEQIVHRKKQGFLFPWNVWMKKELREFCEAHLQSVAQRDFINGRELIGLWKRFLKEDYSVRWMEIWLFVILEYWMQKNGIE